MPFPIPVIHRKPCNRSIVPGGFRHSKYPHAIAPGLRKFKRIHSVGACRCASRIGRRDTHAGDIDPVKITVNLHARGRRIPSAVRRHLTRLIHNFIQVVWSRPLIAPPTRHFGRAIEIVFAAQGVPIGNEVRTVQSAKRAKMRALADGARTGDQRQILFRRSIVWSRRLKRLQIDLAQRKCVGAPYGLSAITHQILLCR